MSFILGVPQKSQHQRTIAYFLIVVGIDELKWLHVYLTINHFSAILYLLFNFFSFDIIDLYVTSLRDIYKILIMMTALTIIQVVIGILLIIVILLQQKSAGLGAGFGGTGSGVTLTKRGADLFLHRITIILSSIFFGIGVLMLIV